MRSEACIGLILITAVLLVYWQVGDHEFINYDDNAYITDNAQVQKGLTSKGIIWAFTTSHTGNWHPLTWISHMLDCELYGLNPEGHHLTNVLFHMANAILLFVVLRWMTGAIWRSGLVAALFALHPLHVESVAWVAERKDVLSTFFWMLTMVVYVHYVNRPGGKRYLLVLITFALGLMAKPMLVTLPFVLLLLDYWPLNRFKPRAVTGSVEDQPFGFRSAGDDKSPILKAVMEKTPLFLMSLFSCVVTVMAQQEAGAISTLEIVPFKLRIANGLVSVVAYMGKMIWPQDLAVFYPHPVSDLQIWKPVVAGLFLLILSTVALWVTQRCRYVLVGWLWYLGTLVPVIGLVQVGEQAMADRYTYVPLIGLFIVVVWGFADLVKGWRSRRWVVSVSAAVMVLALMAGSWLQVAHWKNSVRLFKHALDATSNNYVAHYTLGNALALQGNLTGSVSHYNKALQIHPNFAEAHNNLGNALALQGKLTGAISHYNKALQINPDHAEAHRNLAVGLDRQGRHQEAIQHYAEVLRISPHDAQSHNNLGVALAEQGRLKEAVAHFTEALRIDPNFKEAQRNLDLSLGLMHKSSAGSDNKPR
ncbi:MAG: tetratricopeptide repeat protein [Syntrophobacteria bacterium]